MLGRSIGRVQKLRLPLNGRTTRPFTSSSPQSGIAAPTTSRPAVLAVALGGVAAFGLFGFSYLTKPTLALDAPRDLTDEHPDTPKAPLPEVEKLEELSSSQVEAHKTRESCWVVVDGVVWDLTTFLPAHPGGDAIILKNAGQDVSKLFKSIHPPRTLENAEETEAVKRVGILDAALVARSESVAAEEMARIEAARAKLPPVEQVRGLKEIEKLAETVLSHRAGVYYRGGSDDEVSLRDSFASFQRCRLRPRTLVDVRSVDPRTTILGVPSTLPIYISPAAFARLGHPLGEFNITRGAAKTGIVQGISANSSVSLSELMKEKKDLEAAGSPTIGMSYQIYVNRDRSKTEALIKKAVDGGCQSFFLTVDSPTLGNREEDFRVQGVPASVDDKPHNYPNTDTFSYYDTSMTWDDLAWIKKQCQGRPVFLKGLATVEDVELAKKYGMAGVILSNHGGRQLDCARSPLDTLQEIYEKNPALTKEIEVYIDGGVRRGTDVLKALCLGAKGVGLGRPFLYAQSAYGEQGVIRAVRVMEDEIINSMRFLGVRSVAELKPEHIECLRSTHRIPGSA